MYIDCEVFNRREFGKLADLVRPDRSTEKGDPRLWSRAELQLDQWEDKNGGGKRSKHKLVVENIELLGPRQDGGGGYSGRTDGNRSGGSSPPMDDGGDEYGGGGDSRGGGGSGGGSGGGDSDPIPF